MQTTCAVLTPRVVWCRARAPAGLAKLSQLLALSPWHFIAHGRSESSSKEQISARAFISEIRAHYRPAEPASAPPIYRQESHTGDHGIRAILSLRY